ncbi:MAG: hypothetical protein E6J22_17215 [Chloroflexi bacterium]|nr:MAG: hypothetical protein E6J22_17215 [Chloroflexota bacterium]
MTLQHRGQGLAGVRAEVHNRLACVEALDTQQVGVGLQELSGRRRRGCDVDAEHPITRVGVVDDVERTVTGGHDGRVVDDRGSGNLNKGAVSRAGHGTRLELGEREAVGSWHRDTGGTEIRCALEVDQRLPKRILRRRWGVESHRLHAGEAADADIGELGRIVHAQIMCQPNVGGIQQDEPGGLAIGLPFVQRHAHRLAAEIDLDGALLGQVVPGQQTAELSQSPWRLLGYGRCRPHSVPRKTGHDGNKRCHEQYSDHCDQYTHVCAYQSEKSMLHFISLLVLVVLAVVSKQKMYRSGSTRTPKSTMSKDDREHSAFK